eukprot:CAMPEP_0117472766 /NCGR_PEP_ID=MMETSP0784-20121206/8421_1 /TAXON_ID=39447 /ORGANISM="" /LENGTH=373 /DNA_ID=CAMNT_0005266937 /DNA_START=121 /DNA_END=1242 /DNA_ORIENTATION=+
MFGLASSALDDYTREIIGSEPPTVAIFLSAYMPKTTPHRSAKQALNIVKEQLQQVRISYAASRNATLYIKVVGRDTEKNQNMCKRVHDVGGMICVDLPHVEGGGELHTLSDLHDYCGRAPAVSNMRVVYMHNKGSHHPCTSNVRWRRAMTDAVTTEMCLKPPNRTCNACGLLFDTPPHLFTILFPGNFFAASCEYVKQLLHPMVFAEKTSALARVARSRKSRFHFANNSAKLWVMGTGRYAAEHWIGSHPDIQPCDVSVEREVRYWANHDHVQEEFQWSMFPRSPFNVPDKGLLPADVKDNPDLRLRTYQYLPGLLWRQQSLYKKIPSIETSWHYGLFRDGAFYKDGLARHGAKFIDMVLEPSFDRNGSVPKG